MANNNTRTNIINALNAGTAPMAIAKQFKVTPAYVYNLRSSLKRGNKTTKARRTRVNTTPATQITVDYNMVELRLVASMLLNRIDQIMQRNNTTNN